MGPRPYSVINLTVSVDIEHHVYRLTLHGTPSLLSDKHYGFCGHRAPCLLILLGTPSPISLTVFVDIERHVY